MSESRGKSYPKTDARYWSKPGKLILDSRSKYYGVKLQIAGHRESFPLRTPNKDAAASAAAAIFRDVVAMGWEGAIQKHKPEAAKPDKIATVGELIKAVSELSDVRPATLRQNCSVFRRMVADIAKVKASGSRFAGKGEGRKAWLDKVNAVSLERITPAAVKRWRQEFVAGKSAAGTLAERAARNSANTMMRQCMSMFAKGLLPFLRQRLTLPDPLPFHEIQHFGRSSHRYTGKLDLPMLLEAAQRELRADDPEAFKAFLLALFTGLRRSEMDKLRWSSIDLDGGIVNVVPQVDYAPKAETSLGAVPLDLEACSMLREMRQREPEAEYVLAGKASVIAPNRSEYRAEKSFSRLIEWLRGKGVTDRLPIHTLRKEAGSLVCAGHGLLAASRFLRHADIAITASTYVAQRERATVGLGKLLSQG